MSRSLARRGAAVALALALVPSVAQAAPVSRAVSLWGFWGWLAGFWAKEGPEWDPNGHPSQSPSSPLGYDQSGPDWDPDGRH